MFQPICCAAWQAYRAIDCPGAKLGLEIPRPALVAEEGRWISNVAPPNIGPDCASCALWTRLVAFGGMQAAATGWPIESYDRKPNLGGGSPAPSGPRRRSIGPAYRLLRSQRWAEASTCRPLEVRRSSGGDGRRLSSIAQIDTPELRSTMKTLRTVEAAHRTWSQRHE